MSKNMETVTLNAARITEIKKTLTGTGKNKKYTNTDLARDLGYEHPKTISQFLHGKPIIKEYVEKFANETAHVRLEYLTGKDAYKSNEELLAALNERKLFEYKSTIDYLKSIGINVEPGYYLICSIEEYERNIEKWKCRITEMCGSVGSGAHTKKLCKISEGYLTYDFAADKPKHLDTVIIKELQSEYDDSIYGCWSPNAQIHLLYKVSIPGKAAAFIPIHKMQQFFSFFDETNKSICRNMLSKDLFHDDFLYDV